VVVVMVVGVVVGEGRGRRQRKGWPGLYGQGKQGMPHPILLPDTRQRRQTARTGYAGAVLC
jgi:hypothetical protein